MIRAYGASDAQVRAIRALAATLRRNKRRFEQAELPEAARVISLAELRIALSLAEDLKTDLKAVNTGIRAATVALQRARSRRGR